MCRDLPPGSTVPPVVLVDGEDRDAGDRWETVPTALSDGELDAREAAVSPADAATVFFTSGTTAQAKAVVHGHAPLIASARRLADCLGVGPADAWWGHMPLFWSGGFVIGALTALAGGARIVLHERVDAAAALRLLEAERCTIMAGWHQAGPLLEHPDFDRGRLALSKGSAHPLADRFLVPGHTAVGMYGMSETATCVTCARFDDPEPIRRGTFGRPLAGMEVRIVDPETRAPLPAGRTGRILVRGPTLMRGYLGVAPDETFDADGAFDTGDLGHLDADGYLHFSSRAKDVVKTAGVNVAAVEVEEVLEAHPAVGSAYVVGVPDATRGETVVAFVVASAGGVVEPDALVAFCRGRLASYKVPRYVLPIDEARLPRTGTGKVAKPALRREAAVRLKE